jgi:DNA-binding CsgD family transcriptional regulator
MESDDVIAYLPVTYQRVHGWLTEGCTAADIAARFGVDLTTVRSLIDLTEAKIAAPTEKERTVALGPSVDADLTKAERRVAFAVAGGLTNREAAQALFVSVKTVEFHLGSIYRKLGVRSRTELALRAADAA